MRRQLRRRIALRCCALSLRNVVAQNGQIHASVASCGCLRHVASVVKLRFMLRACLTAYGLRNDLRMRLSDIRIAVRVIMRHAGMRLRLVVKLRRLRMLQFVTILVCSDRGMLYRSY